MEARSSFRNVLCKARFYKTKDAMCYCCIFSSTKLNWKKKRFCTLYPHFVDIVWTALVEQFCCVGVHKQMSNAERPTEPVFTLFEEISFQTAYVNLSPRIKRGMGETILTSKKWHTSPQRNNFLDRSFACEEKLWFSLTRNWIQKNVSQ